MPGEENQPAPLRASPDADTLSVIDRELSEVENLIELQHRKIAALTELRRQFLNGKRSGVWVVVEL